MRPGGISPHVARPVVRFRNNRARGQDFDAGAGIPAIALRCGRTWADVDVARGIAIFDDPAALLNHWQGGVAQL